MPIPAFCCHSYLHFVTLIHASFGVKLKENNSKTIRFNHFFYKSMHNMAQNVGLKLPLYLRLL